MANYNPSGTTITDYSSTKFYPEDTITASYSGAVNPITLPAGAYRLECQGGWGGVGYAGTVTASTSTGYTSITSSNYTSYFSVSNSTYYFAPNTSGYWRASGIGVNSSTSQTIWTCSSAGTYLISYYYLTESGYDKFTLTIGGSTYVSAGSGGAASNSYAVSLSSGSTIVATYAKDGSVHATNEDVYIIIQKQVTSTTYTPSIGNNYWGGYGGYSTGILTLTEPTTLYLYVGGQGNYSSSTTQGTTVAGGFNGGGSSKVRYYHSYYSSGGGGGGATDIRIGQDNLYARVIVAGGGGGGAGESTSSAKYGGGTTGGSEVSEYQATQTAPGTNGSFGTGASATGSANYNYGPGGGGGGWYGGGAATTVSDSDAAFRTYNGGGSGYVYTASTASNYPSGCLLNSNYYLLEASTNNGNLSAYPVAQTTHGAIKITYLAPTFIKTTTTNHAPIKAIYIKTDSTTWKGGEINGYL